MYRSWIRPTLEYGNILYYGAAPSHVRRLDNLQTRIEHTCCSTFESLLHCHHAAIIGFVCCLLARERRAQCFAEVLTSVAGLAVFIPGTLQTMHFIDPCNFRTLDRCRVQLAGFSSSSLELSSCRYTFKWRYQWLVYHT